MPRTPAPSKPNPMIRDKLSVCSDHARLCNEEIRLHNTEVFEPKQQHQAHTASGVRSSYVANSVSCI